MIKKLIKRIKNYFRVRCYWREHAIDHLDSFRDDTEVVQLLLDNAYGISWGWWNWGLRMRYRLCGNCRRANTHQRTWDYIGKKKGFF